MSVSVALQTFWDWVQEELPPSVAEDEQIPSAIGLGRVLAQDICARWDVPGYANSAVDGFAFRHAHLSGEGRATFQLIGQIAAGDTQALHTGDVRKPAVRINTGAVMPEWADSVAMKEHVRAQENTVQIPTTIACGQNVRFADDDVAAGEVLARAGTLLTPPLLGMLSALGYPIVKVHKKIRVEVASSGNEVIPAFALDSAASGPARGRGQLVDSNAPMIVSWLQSMGYVEAALPFEPLPDTPEAVAQFFGAVAEADVVITSGGMSLGAEDHMRRVFAGLGGTVHHWDFAIKPGRPVGFGRLPRPGQAPLVWIGLPGNPVAAHVGLLNVVQPVVGKLAGVSRLVLPDTVLTPMGEARKKKPGRLEFVRVRKTDGMLYPHGKPGAGILSALLPPVGYPAESHGYAILAADKTEIERGEQVDYCKI